MYRIFVATTVLLIVPSSSALGFQAGPQIRPRLRDLGITVGILPVGEHNAITDVQGVAVGHQTLIEEDSIRTGVTVVKLHDGNHFLQKIPAAVHVANGFGKLTGSSQIQELGVIETPIVLTNTISAFAAADTLIGWTLDLPGCEKVLSVNPVVGECNDGFLNDIRARRVTAKDVRAALQAAHGGPVDEGCVGAGTGVRCMGWKGGIGTSSRVLPQSLGGFTIGVLVQTNFGGSLTIDGVPVGRDLDRYYLKDEVRLQEHGSCIVIVATDAPLDSRRLQRLARRAPLGLGAVGSSISHGSGDYVLAFSTAPHLRSAYQSDKSSEITELLRDDHLSPLFQAVKDATQEAVVNSILQATSTTGHLGRTVDAIDPAQVVEVLRRYGRDTKLPPSKGLSRIGVSSPREYGIHPSASLLKRIAQFESSLPDWMTAYNVPGVSLALVEDHRLVWSRGYGVRSKDGGGPVQPETVMEACSMSKPFYAYCVLKLVEQGNFDLDRPLVAYLGNDYLSGDPRHRKITARMVLAHTSGLPNWRPGGWRGGGPMSLAFDPGSRFQYSGEGFLMLQRAVESISEMGIDEFSRSSLIRPLGLKHTRFVWDERLMIHAAGGHDQKGKLKTKRSYYDEANSAYSLYTSAEDYARFLVEMMNPDRSAAHSLGDNLLKEMLTPHSHREEQNADWGLGWGMRSIDGHQLVYHSGSNGSGFRCYSEFQPGRGTGLVLMTNAVGGKKLWAAAVEQWHRDDT